MDPFIPEARALYAEANAAALDWMLGRPALGAGFLNTKLNPLTLADYGPQDGLRGPGFLYGWIQGRGLEALAGHAAFYASEAPELSMRLDAAAGGLHGLLAEFVRRDGHAYFRYDADMCPVRKDADGAAVAQVPEPAIYTYSDAFAAKGLVAAAARLGLPGLADHLGYLGRVIAAVEEGRFQMNEDAPLGAGIVAAEPEDFGPRMILLGAAGMLARAGIPERAGYADRFIAHVLERHFDPATGLLRNVPGEDVCNVGHAIEFVGFALDHLPADADPGLVGMLETILGASFRLGFVGPGIALTVSAATGRPASPYCPWWSLPEAVRAAALCLERTGSGDALDIWKAAHGAFFGLYWRGRPPVAYQCRTAEGPVDYVPATPDLDPGYHTGLSLLAAIGVADRMTSINGARAGHGRG